MNPVTVRLFLTLLFNAFLWAISICGYIHGLPGETFIATVIISIISFVVWGVVEEQLSEDASKRH